MQWNRKTIKLKDEDGHIMTFKSVEELLKSVSQALNVEYEDEFGEWI